MQLDIERKSSALDANRMERGIMRLQHIDRYRIVGRLALLAIGGVLVVLVLTDVATGIGISRTWGFIIAGSVLILALPFGEMIGDEYAKWLFRSEIESAFAQSFVFALRYDDPTHLASTAHAEFFDAWNSRLALESTNVRIRSMAVRAKDLSSTA